MDLQPCERPFRRNCSFVVHGQPEFRSAPGGGQLPPAAMGIAGLAEKPRPQPDPVRSSVVRMRLASSTCSRALSASDRARDGSERRCCEHPPPGGAHRQSKVVERMQDVLLDDGAVDLEPLPAGSFQQLVDAQRLLIDIVQFDSSAPRRPKVAHDVVTQSGPGPQAAQWRGRERCLRARLRRDNIGAILMTVVNCEWIRGCRT